MISARTSARTAAALTRFRTAVQDVACRLELAQADAAYERALAVQITDLEQVVAREGVTPFSRSCFAKLGQRVLLSDRELAALSAALT